MLAVIGLMFRQMVAMSINYGALFSDMVLRDFQPTCIFVHKVVRCHIMFSLKIHQRYMFEGVISKSKGPSETLRDIRTSTYQMCRMEENTNRTTKFHK